MEEALLVKEEPTEIPKTEKKLPISQHPHTIIDLSSSDSDYSSDSGDETGNRNGGDNGGGSSSSSRRKKKRQKLDELGIVLPLGFLDPLPSPSQQLQQSQPQPVPLATKSERHYQSPVVSNSSQGGSKQFWKAGDYEDSSPLASASVSTTVGMDHVRVHPKFLHSNATSHKWALGAFAELLDNALDEVFYGCTFVNVDMLENKKDGSRMLVIEDNGGGMGPDKMRQCMSLGYSAKSKMANVIGQYGNGFKTSTMRLGADVIVFSRCRGEDGKSPTQSIGMLSYTYLRSTAKEDIVVPMLDFEKAGTGWNKLLRSSPGDWDINMDTLVQWSPYTSEDDLFQQFYTMGDQGTRIIIYNLWENDQGELELDFDTDPHDIQIRGVNRDEQKIAMAKKYPNSRHFLTYRHSLRSYASILYLRRPPRFRIVLRGKDVEHHNIVNDMMLSQEVTYRPTGLGPDAATKDTNMVAVVRIGFVKDAKDHIDVQGFNVYHKNRLIKPFWKVWSPAGSEGRGVIGVLEADFIEPAHDKQGFERTTVLARLESRLQQMQKTYWKANAHLIGYTPRLSHLRKEQKEKEASPDYSPHSEKSSHLKKTTHAASKDKPIINGKGVAGVPASSKYGIKSSYSAEDDSDSEMRPSASKRPPISFSHKGSPNSDDTRITRSRLKEALSNGNGHVSEALGDNIINQLRRENFNLKDRLKELEHRSLVNGDSDLVDGQGQNQLTFLKNRMSQMDSELQFEKDRYKSLEMQVKEYEQKMEDMSKEQEALIDIFSDEKSRRDSDEENLRKKLKEASNTIQELLDRVKELEKFNSSQNCKPEP
ncbi:hypothetical protein ACHQM5_010398 [Ranunculus cassubicifolius]